MFNLLDEKWLLGVRENGILVAASIKDCMFRDFKEVKSPDFHGKHFYLYDYLAIRLLSAIAADILICTAKEYPDDYDDTIEKIVAKEISSGKISNSFEKAANQYFNDYHDRFDLFDEVYPFMQFASVKKSVDKMLKLNPLAPADSGRLFPEAFHSQRRISIDEAINLTDGKEVCNLLKDQFTTTPQEVAYILLYLSSIAPGVGSGNKTVLAGNAFVFETLMGKCLRDTILLNMPISGYLFDDDDDPVDFGKPVWRWENPEEVKQQVLTTGKIKMMEGIFFPVKSIHMEAENKKIALYEYSIPEGQKKEFGKVVDALRNLWATKYEPHALLAQVKSTDTKKPINPYRKVSPGDHLWLLLAATAQTEQTTLQEMKGKKIVNFIQSSGSSHHIQELSRTSSLPEIIRVRYYYRMASDKWVYYRTGYADGEIPKEVLEDLIRQKYLCEMTQYITDVKNAFRKYGKMYFANTSGDPSKSVSKDVLDKVDCSKYEKIFMDSIQPIFIGPQSFLFEISKTSDLDETYHKWKSFIRKNALNVFSKLMDQKRIESFWFYYDRLRKECMQLWKTKNSQNSKKN